VRVDLLALAPLAVGRLVDEATAAWTERSALGGAPDAMLFWQVFQPLLRVGGLLGWSICHRRVLVKVLSNGGLPGQPRGKDACCAVCGAAASACHLAHGCNALELARMQQVSVQLGRSARALQDDPAGRERFSRGLLPHPRALLPPALDASKAPFRWHNEPTDGFPIWGNLFLDGSVLGADLGAPRAGWAAVHVDGEGRCVAAAYGAAPADPCPGQTIADAEDLAAIVLALVAMDPLVMHIDRQGIVDTALGPLAAAVGRRPWSFTGPPMDKVVRCFRPGRRGGPQSQGPRHGGRRRGG
jgi:hypothetical protein